MGLFDSLLGRRIPSRASGPRTVAPAEVRDGGPAAHVTRCPEHPEVLTLAWACY